MTHHYHTVQTRNNFLLSVVRDYLDCNVSEKYFVFDGMNSATTSYYFDRTFQIAKIKSLNPI